jgi:hypothetical protein
LAVIAGNVGAPHAVASTLAATPSVAPDRSIGTNPACLDRGPIAGSAVAADLVEIAPESKVEILPFVFLAGGAEAVKLPRSSPYGMHGSAAFAAHTQATSPHMAAVRVDQHAAFLIRDPQVSLGLEALAQVQNNDQVRERETQRISIE